MRFRLESEEVISLYASGQAPAIPIDVREAFFGVLEAVEAAVGLTDLDALFSVSPDYGPGTRVGFPLHDGWSLQCHREPVADEMVLVVNSIVPPVIAGE
jgi:hypothetical protein